MNKLAQTKFCQSLRNGFRIVHHGYLRRCVREIRPRGFGIVRVINHSFTNSRPVRSGYCPDFNTTRGWPENQSPGSHTSH
jgi:hypothetical protein